MAFDPVAVGRAFSEHRFDEALSHLAKDVKWTIVGGMILEGADAVRRTCRDTQESLAGAEVQFDRCVTVGDRDTVAVDTVVRYLRPDGVTAVASCAIYEFSGDTISAITSYAVEVDPEDAGAQPPPRM
ncbi:Limonene-1,2-epoxide hydrolase catalytic domain protein [Mycolicibacterium aurum]|uniref:Limonene-1,2-epoxide hydrolase catalytic domain protein n=1 Tax=Mycolicibacterium aurum TaxID=1791 RepID=A0A448IWG4_MYCAU|nr:nuclear transport factor 2 family protein [Mycolicibacterium aurum]VEG56657.1 Limonene-1,2-epoxide hydrolase catalytic domain protein [Mycolicibacterium aurum]